MAHAILKLSALPEEETMLELVLEDLVFAVQVRLTSLFTSMFTK